MLADSKGKEFLSALTDQTFRSREAARVTDQVTYLLKQFGIPMFLSSTDRLALEMLKGHTPLARLLTAKLRKQMRGVILPAEERPLRRHLRRREKEGVRMNLNHLGEAILGEEEARHRLGIYLEHLAQPEVEYVSVKISSLCSHLNLLAAETLERLSNRLRTLYRYSMRHPGRDGAPKFINLDMEEYHDLHLTVDLFRKVLDEEEFFELEAGIVLQAYIPESHLVQQELTEWASVRVQQGGGPIKIRIVRGANLAMERVTASIEGWEQGPYSSKEETDANFKRMLTYGLHPNRVRSVRIGIATHNLLDIAYALLLTAENDVKPYVVFEMLEGMCDHQRRIIQQVAGDMLLYCPAATKEEFPHAISYLVRRLDENTSPDNFLAHLPDLATDGVEWGKQVKLFRNACHQVEAVSSRSRRTQNRLVEPTQPAIDSDFNNEPNTDWSLPHNRRWAEELMAKWRTQKLENVPVMIAGEVEQPDKVAGEGRDPSRPDQLAYRFTLARQSDVKRALQHTQKAGAEWNRDVVLAQVAQELRRRRGELIGAMVADGGKLIPEADGEVSEAIDFVEYYRREALILANDPTIDCKAKGLVLVIPPWNFPCAIPTGGISAALAAGNRVLFKPAPEAVYIGWKVAEAFWAAGVPKSALQFLSCDEEAVGAQLIQSKVVDTVILTGATATARLFYQLRPDLRLMAETGGKNGIVVSNLADQDLAIQDVVTSAFGHAGQKCSACSLLILHRELYDDPSFLASLADAASSLRVGSAWDLATDLNPLIRPPGPDLTRALTTLEPGEEWLLEPQQDEDNPNLWSPGIKIGVSPGSYTHQTEFFGPLLAVLRAETFTEALEIANSTPYGLTAGVHTLDDREVKQWQETIEAGNLYVNRTITGAIVRRQPFGGCKASGFGPGAKAGGPGYLPQLMHITQTELPTDSAKLPLTIRSRADLIEDEEQRELYLTSTKSYAYWWERLRQPVDPSLLLGQDNLFQHVPRGKVVLRVQKGNLTCDILRVLAACEICGTRLEVSWERRKRGPADLQQVLPHCTVETEEELCARLESMDVKQLRVLALPSKPLTAAAAEVGIHIAAEPVLATGRYELAHYIREVATSINYHRYGNLGIRTNEARR